MKIGILTFWTSQDNYGQLLQAFALQKYLLKEGHDPFIIRYDHRNDFKRSFVSLFFKVFNPQKLTLYFVDKYKTMLLNKGKKYCSRDFDNFRKQFFKFSSEIYYSFDELKKNPPDADCYIVGSDQVWNFGSGDIIRIKNWVHAYFLDFGKNEIKKISYAASWGRESISSEQIKEITPLLTRFQYVSVREQTGINLCQKCGCNSAELVCDPTLLFDANYYRSFYSEQLSIVNRPPYLFLYMLDNGYNFPLDKIYDWAITNKLKVVYVTGNGTVTKRKTESLTVPEWLYYIDHASAVVTNSFHCTVFSILFEKSFGVIPLVGKNSGMNSRMNNLFSITGIGDRFLRKISDVSLLNQAVSPSFKLTRDKLKTILNDL